MRLLAVLILLAGSLPAAAQGYFRDRGAQRGTPGDFDFYVLSLSWSPTFCQSEAGQRNQTQCGIRQRSEFVVHGLWPQYERGYPSNCGAFNRPVPRNAMQKAAEIFPDERLARHEWNKHGTCSGKGPSEYFDDVAEARSKVVIPRAFDRTERDVETSVQDIERAFVAANRGLRNDMMSVQCRRRQVTEVLLCLSKDLREFVPCAEVDRTSCRSREVTLPAVR